jgi:hypothetical protein
MGAAVIGAGIVGAAGLASAAIGSSASKSAAQTQANAANQSAATQLAMYEQTVARNQPFVDAGTAATSRIQNMEPFTNPGGTFNFQPTQAQLEATPGYQFSRSQGLKATQNSMAAQGLGSSGAAMAGAAKYAVGLADSTYQNQFKNALDSYTTNFDAARNTYATNLGTQQSLAQLGENAATLTGAQGTTAAANIGQSNIGAANASAAGTIGAANATSAGIGSIANAYLYGQNQFQNQQNASIYQAAPSPGYNYYTEGD